MINSYFSTHPNDRHRILTVLDAIKGMSYYDAKQLLKFAMDLIGSTSCEVSEETVDRYFSPTDGTENPYRKWHSKIEQPDPAEKETNP